MSELTPGTLDLLNAIAEALDIPYPNGADDDRPYVRLMETRISLLRASLTGLLDDEKNDHANPSFDAGYIRKSAARHPVTYTPYALPAKQEAGQP